VNRTAGDILAWGTAALLATVGILIGFGWSAMTGHASPLISAGNQLFIESVEGLTGHFHADRKKDAIRGHQTARGGNYVRVFKDGDRGHVYCRSVQRRRNSE